MKVGSQFLERQLGEKSLLKYWELYSTKNIETAFIKAWKSIFHTSTITPTGKKIQRFLLEYVAVYMDKVMQTKYLPQCREQIQNIMYTEVYEVYTPKKYKRRYDLLDLPMDYNLRLDFVNANKMYYLVLEIDGAFNKSILGQETLDTGLPAMLDEVGIPPLPFLSPTVEQPWTEPRPFWDKTLSCVESILF